MRRRQAPELRRRQNGCFRHSGTTTTASAAEAAKNGAGSGRTAEKALIRSVPARTVSGPARPGPGLEYQGLLDG